MEALLFLEQRLSTRDGVTSRGTDDYREKPDYSVGKVVNTVMGQVVGAAWEGTVVSKLPKEGHVASR